MIVDIAVINPNPVTFFLLKKYVLGRIPWEISMGDHGHEFMEKCVFDRKFWVGISRSLVLASSQHLKSSTSLGPRMGLFFFFSVKKCDRGLLMGI